MVICSHQVALHPFHESDVNCSLGKVYVPNPHNCGQFYQCLHGEPILRSCPVGLYFNPITLNCDWPFAVSTMGCSQPLEFGRDYNGTAREIVFLRKVGELSDSSDDSPSATVCPEGTVPIDCACSAPRRCDGAIISNRKCKVFNAFPQQGQQAIATCFD
ncbi:protein obstructor-E-like [Liolophura sinensis]|uniref:protein obstructor-E-like n=1 Tax=Liolophura sinensis TaxID=3198878 RepID=UPI0031581421